MALSNNKPKRVRGELLARARKGHATLNTRDKVAVAAGINSKSVQRAEMGHASFETLELIACALGVSPWDFWIPLEGSVPGRGPAASDASGDPAPAPWFIEAIAPLEKKINELQAMLKRMEPP